MSTTYDSQTELGPTGLARTAVLIWGILMVVAGVFLLTRPAVTVIIWVEIIAFSWLIGGIFDIVSAFGRQTRYRIWRFVAGVISVVAGLYIIGNPVLGTLFVINIAFVLIAASAVVDGVVNIASAFSASGGARLAGIILGILQLFVGIWLFLHPIAGMLALIPIFSILLIVGGIIAVIAAFRAAE